MTQLKYEERVLILNLDNYENLFHKITLEKEISNSDFVVSNGPSCVIFCLLSAMVFQFR